MKWADVGSVFLGRNVVIDNRHPELISIGKDVWITTGSVILSHSYVSRLQEREYGFKEKIGSVEIQDGVFIGANSTILPGVSIGRGSYIGAGSVVVHNVPADVLAVGNPAKVVRSLHKV